MRSSKVDIAALLGRAALFHGLAEEQLARLGMAAREKRFTKGELVFQKGDQPTALFFVATGQIKEACQSSSGEEKIIEMLGPNQTCGEAALFLDCPYPFFVAALKPTLMIQIERKAILDLFGSEPIFVKRMLCRISARLYALVVDIETYTVHSPLRRAVGYLLEQNFAGTPAAGATSVVTLPAPKAVIASRLGITPEALSRSLRDLIDAGLIEVHGQHVRILDRQRLKAFAP